MSPVRVYPRCLPSIFSFAIVALIATTDPQHASAACPSGDVYATAAIADGSTVPPGTWVDVIVGADGGGWSGLGAGGPMDGEGSWSGNTVCLGAIDASGLSVAVSYVAIGLRIYTPDQHGNPAFTFPYHTTGPVGAASCGPGGLNMNDPEQASQYGCSGSFSVYSASR